MPNYIYNTLEIVSDDKTIMKIMDNISENNILSFNKIVTVPKDFKNFILNGDDEIGRSIILDENNAYNSDIFYKYSDER